MNIISERSLIEVIDFLSQIRIFLVYRRPLTASNPAATISCLNKFIISQKIILINLITKEIIKLCHFIVAKSFVTIKIIICTLIGFLLDIIWQLNSQELLIDINSWAFFFIVVRFMVEKIEGLLGWPWRVLGLLHMWFGVTRVLKLGFLK